MRPTKNRVYCIGCRHPKMLFESQTKAETFIKFNRDEIASYSDKVPLRSYYCSFCCGWHVTSVDGEDEAEANDKRDEYTWRQIKNLGKYKLSLSPEGQKISEMLVSVQSMIQKCQRQLMLTNLGEASNLYKKIVLEFSAIEDMAFKHKIVSSRINRIKAKVEVLQNTFNIIDEYDIDNDTRNLFLSKPDSSCYELATRYLRNKKKKKSKDRISPHKSNTNNNSLYISIIELLEQAHKAIKQSDFEQCNSFVNSAEALMPVSSDEVCNLLWIQIHGLRGQLSEHIE